jgi:hypothetical protein
MMSKEGLYSCHYVQLDIFSAYSVLFSYMCLDDPLISYSCIYVDHCCAPGLWKMVFANKRLHGLSKLTELLGKINLVS